LETAPTQHPACVALDRAQDERRQALAIEALPDARDRARARERGIAVEYRAAAEADDRVDAGAMQARGAAFVDVDERHELTADAAVLARQLMPYALHVVACEEARDRAAGRHAAGVAARLDARANAREIRERVVAAQARAARREQRGVDGAPRARRIPDQKRAPPLAVARGREK